MPDLHWWNDLFLGVLRALTASIDAKDTAKFVSYLTPDGEFIFGNAPAAVGHAAVGAAVSGFFAAIGGCRHRLTATWDGPESAVGEGTVTYTRLDGRSRCPSWTYSTSGAARSAATRSTWT